MSAAGWARGRILAALAFLAWLDDRGTTLGAATQADVDDWLHGATHYRYLLRDFLTWASARRLAGQVTVPALPSSELTGLITEDSRWQLLSRCLRDPGIPLDVRTAGALLLLYGQLDAEEAGQYRGRHIQTAVNWASHTRRDWTAYIAERVSAPCWRPTVSARWRPRRRLPSHHRALPDSLVGASPSSLPNIRGWRWVCHGTAPVSGCPSSARRHSRADAAIAALDECGRTARSRPQRR